MANFDAYTVAIKLSVVNLASQGIKLIASDMLVAHGAATKLQDKLSALKMTAVGYGLNSMGSGILGFMEKSIDASKEYTSQLALMNAAGMSQKDIAESTAAAWQTSRDVITSSASENLLAIRELRSVFGKDHMHEAYGILPTVQRTKAALEAMTGKEQHGVAFDMVKAIELRTPGVMTQDRMQSNADLMSRTLMQMGGTLNVNDFHMALKQAKTAAFGLSDDFVYKYLPTFMQEVKTKEGGAQSAGTALMTTYQAIIGGKLKKSALPLWESMGLISPSDVVRNATGQMQLKPGAVKDSSLFQANPFDWANNVLAPAIAAYGAKTGLNREQVLAGMFADRNSQWEMNTLIGKAAQFERDRKLIESGSNSYETYQKLLQTSPVLAQQAMQSQWQNVQARIGFEVLPRLIPYMVKFADGLDGISQWMEKHGTTTTAIALGIGGIGISLSIVGKVLMGAGMIKFLGLGPTLAGMAPSLASVATGLVLIGKTAGLFMAGYAGWVAGGWLNDKLNDKMKVWTDGKNDSFGGWVYDKLHKDDTAEWNSQFVRSRGQQPGQMINNKIVMPDGRVLAEVVTHHQSVELMKPLSGTTRFDGRMSLAPIGSSGRF